MSKKLIGASALFSSLLLGAALFATAQEATPAPAQPTPSIPEVVAPAPTPTTPSQTAPQQVPANKQRPSRRGPKGEKPNAQRAEKKQVDPACMLVAVEKRDSRIVSALDAYYNAVKTALSGRLAAQKSAWSLTDAAARREALKKVWNEFRETQKKHATTFRTAKRDAWKQFKTDIRACGSQGASDDPTTESVDTQL